MSKYNIILKRNEKIFLSKYPSFLEQGTELHNPGLAEPRCALLLQTSVDPDQLASTDLNLHCLSFSV